MPLPRLACLFLALGCAAFADEVWPDANALPAASYPNAATREIDLGHGVTVAAKFELTTKGNGGLVVPGWGLRVYDAERDGVTFGGYLLRCEWRDLNADGYLDLVVSGMAQYWSRDRRHLESEKPIAAVLHYVPARGSFDLVKADSEIFSWEERSAVSGRPSSTEK